MPRSRADNAPTSPKRLSSRHKKNMKSCCGFVVMLRPAPSSSPVLGERVLHLSNFQMATPTNNAAAQAESEARKAQAKEENAAAAGAICENAEAKAEDDERLCKGNMKSDSVVTVASWTCHSLRCKRRRRAHQVQQRSCQT